MTAIQSRFSAALFAVGVFAMTGLVSMEARAQAPAIDPAASQILKRMADYLNSLKQFSMHTETDLEDMIPTGQRVDAGVAADVIIRRPNKMRAQRRGDLVDQDFYFDGKTIALFNPKDKVYAAQAAPATLGEMLTYVRGTLGLGIPAGDLVYPDVYPLLMQNVTFAKVVGKAVVSGVTCDHLVFSRPGVDFQVWVADKGQPLPYKYVVTDRSTPERLSVGTVMSKWNVAPKVTDATFSFVPPQGTRKIPFMQPASTR